MSAADFIIYTLVALGVIAVICYQWKNGSKCSGCPGCNTAGKRRLSCKPDIADKKR